MDDMKHEDPILVLTTKQCLDDDKTCSSLKDFRVLLEEILKV